MTISMADENKTFLVDNIRAGNVCLFLGAGASVGAEARGDNAVLTGDGLKAAIASKYNLGDVSRRSLRQVYGAAVQGFGVVNINNYLVDLLKGCTATWQQIIPSLLWKRIYTTNIDDVIISAFIKSRQSMQAPIWKNYKMPFNRDIDQVDGTQVVFLHGNVRYPKSGFVFDYFEYSKAIQSNLPWHTAFSTDFFSGPFLFVGTQLDEPDLVTYLRYRENNIGNAYKMSLKSFLITKDVDKVIQNDLGRLGIICVQSLADEFFSWLEKEVTGRLRRSEIIASKLPKIASYKSDKSRTAYTIFRSQFVDISSIESPDQPDQNLHDFFSGDEPDWWDIFENNDAELSIVKNGIDLIKKSKNKLFVVEGTAGCGKTTTLMRIAKLLKEENWQVFFFNDINEIHADSAVRVLRTTNGVKTLLVITGAADNIDQIDIIARKLDLLNPKCDLNITILSEERGYRISHIKAAAKNVLYSFIPMNWLNEHDVNSLLSKLTEKDKLRAIRSYSYEEQKDFFYRTANLQLLVAMREISKGGRFDSIIASDFKKIPSDIAKDIYILVCLCHSRQDLVSADVVHRVFRDRIKHDEALDLVENGDLRGIVIIKNGYLASRHPVIASEVLHSYSLRAELKTDKLRDIVIKLMISIAPLVTKDTLLQGTPESKIAKKLMDYDHLDHVFRNDFASINEFFYSLKDSYGWNSKYWAQRGLFESARHRYDDAIDFVDHAATIDTHWTIRNSQGVVYLRAACSDWFTTPDKAERYYENGINILRQVLVDTGYSDKRNVIALLKYSLRYFERWKGHLKKEFSKLVEEISTIVNSNFPMDAGLESLCNQTKSALIKSIVIK